jgi:hypothetical protein
MVPFADFINHHNVDSSYEFVSRNVNPTAESDGLPKGYFTVSKKEIDYRGFFPVVEGELIERSEEFVIQNNRSLNQIKNVKCR